MESSEAGSSEDLLEAQNTFVKEALDDNCAVCIAAQVSLLVAFDRLRMERNLFVDGEPNVKLFAEYYGSYITKKCTEIDKCEAATRPSGSSSPVPLRWRQ